MKKLFYSSLVLAVAILCVACSGGKSVEEAVPFVKTQLVGDAASTLVNEFPGRVKAAKDVSVSFKVNGTLQYYALKEGDHFKKGAVLAVMDPKDYRLQYDAALAQYNQVKAQAQRIMNLYKDSVVSADKYDQARYGLEQVTAKYEFAKNQLNDCRIYAPFDGVVNKRYFESGTTVGAGMPVMAIVSSGVPEIEIEIPAKILNMKSNFSGFSARLDSPDQQEVKLSLIGISPKANANQLYSVRLSIDPSVKEMPFPGMNTMVRVHFKSRDFEYFSIPVTSVFNKDGKSYVWILAGDSKVRMREVRIEALHTDGTADISLGLESGNVIVSAGVHKLHEGEKVQVLKETSPTNVGSLL